MKNFWILLGVIGIALGGCSSSEKKKAQAKDAAARYWQEKAYPGKAYDVQVTEAEKADDGMIRVKGIVDGESRVGMFNPETENFSEGFYSLAHEKTRRVAELEQEVKYWKEKTESLEKELYKMKVQLKVSRKGDADDEDDQDEKPAKKKKKSEQYPATVDE